MTKETEKLNKIIKDDKDLSYSLEELALNSYGFDDNYEDEFSVTELQIINKILKYHGNITVMNLFLILLMNPAIN